ncbi:TM2 domain-containing protein [Dialister sp.]|jgi:TM2 domain-containing membrane protein YozV|uniref:TM2 domain-containing protein n=1 Tax=Dialister sp. TaxID=1955814 RepID=UPI003A5B95B7
MEPSFDADDIQLLNRLSDRQKNYVLTTYAAREKKTSTAYILWIVFAVYYFYLGRPVRNILLWLLMCCFIGWIWWLVDLFRISGMVKDKNREILLACTKEASLLYPEKPASKDDLYNGL